MQVPHRQGIVKSVPNFLQVTGGTVSIVIPLPGYILVTVADGESDYLFSETSSVPHAWTGPFQSGTNYWLYWDIHPLTGAKTYGHTLYEPIESSSAPLSPVGDQHWFDTSSNTMKVWNAAVGRWVNKIRVFAARLTGLSVFVSMSINSPAYEGTQIGSYLTAPVLAGFLVYDDQGKAIRKSDGKFFTTESSGVTGMHTASRVKLSGIVKEAESTANMARNTVVVFTDFDKIGPANPYLSTQQKQFGIIEEDVVIGDFINVITEGMVSSSDWDWTPFSVNTPLYVGAGGVLTTEATPPALTPVALITGKQTINFGTPRVVSTTVGGSIVDVMTPTTQGTGKLSVAAVDNQDPIVVGDNDPRLTDARTPLAHDHDGAYEPVDATILRDADIGVTVAGTSHTHADYVGTAGGTLTGFLTLHADPTDVLHAASKQYVDTQPQIATFVTTNELVVNLTGTVGWFPPKNGQILSVTAMVSTPPSGSDVVLGIRKNGTSIMGVQVLSILDGANQAVPVTLTAPVDIVTTDFITIDITQVGSTTPGSDLTVRITYK